MNNALPTCTKPIDTTDLRSGRWRLPAALLGTLAVVALSGCGKTPARYEVLEWHVSTERPGWSLPKDKADQEFVIVKLHVHGDSPIVWKMPEGYTVDSQSIELVPPSGEVIHGSFDSDGAQKFASVSQQTDVDLPEMVFIVPKAATSQLQVRSLKMSPVPLTAETRRTP